MVPFPECLQCAGQGAMSFPKASHLPLAPAPQAWVLGLGGLSEKVTFEQSPETMEEECCDRGNSRAKTLGQDPAS